METQRRENEKNRSRNTSSFGPLLLACGSPKETSMPSDRADPTYSERAQQEQRFFQQEFAIDCQILENEPISELNPFATTRQKEMPGPDSSVHDTNQTLEKNTSSVFMNINDVIGYKKKNFRTLLDGVCIRSVNTCPRSIGTSHFFNSLTGKLELENSGSEFSFAISQGFNLNDSYEKSSACITAFVFDFFKDAYEPNIVNIIRTFYIDMLYQHLFSKHTISSLFNPGTEVQTWIFEYETKIDWYEISRHNFLCPDFMEKFKTQLNWHEISKHQSLSESSLYRFFEFLHWDNIIQYQILSEEFMSSHSKIMNWSLISRYQVLSEKFMRAHHEKLDWVWISKNQILSESFIEEFQDLVNWKSISAHQTLSEEFIERFKMNLDWTFICKHQDLSESFIQKNENLVDWIALISRKNWSSEFIKKNKPRIPWWSFMLE